MTETEKLYKQEIQSLKPEVKDDVNRLSEIKIEIRTQRALMKSLLGNSSEGFFSENIEDLNKLISKKEEDIQAEIVKRESDLKNATGLEKAKFFFFKFLNILTGGRITSGVLKKIIESVNDQDSIEKLEEIALKFEKNKKDMREAFGFDRDFNEKIREAIQNRKEEIENKGKQNKRLEGASSNKEIDSSDKIR